jgi:chemotaxis protein CheZ
VQRKIFRVERMLGGRVAAPVATAAYDKVTEPKAAHACRERPDAADSAVQALKRELALLQDTIARNKRELAALIGDGHDRRMAHAAGKLGAAVEGMEKATVKILKSTEVIDDSAKALAAALKTDYERDLAQDIQDHVVKIYEACNFQDLAGQRIGNVIATLNMIDDQVASILDRCRGQPGDTPAAEPFSGRGLLHGPRLDGASGHTSQSDIDVLFD